jgi:hypothetical protein
MNVVAETEINVLAGMGREQLQAEMVKVQAKIADHELEIKYMTEWVNACQERLTSC